MSRGLRSGDWYLISEQKFRRRAAVQGGEQRFRGEGYFVLSDQVTGQHLRLTQRAAQLWHSFDGVKTAQQIWEDFTKTAGPTQSEIFQWIMTLVSSGMLISDHELDPKSFSDRGLRKRDQMLEAKLAGPLSIKLRLFDPHRIISAIYPFVRPLFSYAGGLGVALLILAALVTAVSHWQNLAQSVDRNILTQSGLISLALAYPLLKAIHELGHGLMVHRFGGEVREFGVMFLIFFPVPYVEASESNGFASKYHRMLVAGAGVMAELLVAALSLFAWLYMEPGAERALLFNFMIIGSVSTLLFNGNPLLKFDSYYVLADWLEIPNLATRAGAYLQDRFLSRLLGLRPQVHASRSEATIFWAYGSLSLIYRWVLAVSIVLIVSQMFFVFGIILAAWSLLTTFLMPLRKLVKDGLRMAKMQNQGPASFWRFAVAALVVFGLVAVLKLPFSAQGEGQVTVLPQAELRLETSGEVAEVLQQSGAILAKGDPILRVVNPNQTARLQVLRIAQQDLTERLRAGGLGVIDRQAALRELALTQEDLQRAEQQERARVLLAPQAGRLEWNGGRAPLQGSVVFRGDGLGRVISSGQNEIVVSLAAAYAGFLPQVAAQADIRLPNGDQFLAPIARARVIDQGQQAPAPILVSGGGRVPEMPNAPGLALDSALVVWLAPQVDMSAYVGMRVAARIELPKATLWQQSLFYLRRLFLRASRV